MKMNFSKDELAMVYQYAAGTKEDTLAGLKEIVPVIRDRQTREIVESTIRKLDAIPEPECRRFIADTKQHFIQKRDNSIRRRACRSHSPDEDAEATAQEKAARPGTVIIASRAAARGLPLWKRAQLYTGQAGALRPAGGVLRTAEDFQKRSGSCQSSQGKLHFPCAGCRQLPLCGLAARKHLALQAVPGQQVYNFTERIWKARLTFCLNMLY